MSTLKTHNLQSPDSGSSNIALTPNAGMVVTGISTFSNNLDINANIDVSGIITATSYVGNIGGTPTFSGDITIPDKIIHDGDTNTAIRFPAADTVTVETAGDERLRITSDGRLLLGTTNAGGNNTANHLVVANNDSASDQSGISIRGGTSGRSQIFFSDGTSGQDEYRGMLRYDHSENSMQFRTNAVERFRIHSSGVPQFTTTGTQYASASVPAFVVNSNGDHALVLNNQNTTDPRGLFIYQDQDVNNGTSYFWRARAGGTDRAHLYSNGTLQLHSGNLKLASGNGIDFSATGDASGMSSELLDDYEEGTFTPTETSGANLTLTTAAGLYTRVGRMVHIQVRIKYPSTTNANHARIGGFPFTPSIYGANISNGANASGFGYCTASFIPQLHMNQSQTYTNFYNFSTIVTNANFSGREIRFGIVYSAA